MNHVLLNVRQVVLDEIIRAVAEKKEEIVRSMTTHNADKHSKYTMVKFSELKDNTTFYMNDSAHVKKKEFFNLNNGLKNSSSLEDYNSFNSVCLDNGNFVLVPDSAMVEVECPYVSFEQIEPLQGFYRAKDINKGNYILYMKLLHPSKHTNLYVNIKESLFNNAFIVSTGDLVHVDEVELVIVEDVKIIRGE